MSDYQRIVVETYQNPGKASRKSIRVRPLEGQGFSAFLNVECSAEMREGHKIGTKFLLYCKLKSKNGGSLFLYSSYKWEHKILSDEVATKFIKDNFGSTN